MERYMTAKTWSVANGKPLEGTEKEWQEFYMSCNKVSDEGEAKAWLKRMIEEGHLKKTPGAGENSHPVEAEPAIKAFYPDAKIEVCHGSGECCKCNRYGRECEGIAHIPPNMEPCAEHRS